MTPALNFLIMPGLEEGVLTSIISGAAALGSAATSGAVNATANRRAYKWTRRLQDEQNRWNLQTWAMQNAYNKPSAMMKRYEDAGVNPMLVTGQGSGGNAGSVAPASSVQFQDQLRGDFGINAAINVLSQLAQLKKIKADTDNAQKDTELKQSGIEKNNAEISAINENAAWTATRNAIDVLKKDNFMPVQLDKLKNELVGVGLQNNLLSLHAKSERLKQDTMKYQLDSILPLESVLRYWQGQNARYQREFLSPATRQHIMADIGRINSQTNLNNTTIGKIAADTIARQFENYYLGNFGLDQPGTIKFLGIPVGAASAVGGSLLNQFGSKLKGLIGKTLLPRSSNYYPYHF